MIKWIIGKGLLACVVAAWILCGCTRREQLVLEAGGGQSVGEKAESEAGQDGLSDNIAADAVSTSGQDQSAVRDGEADVSVQSVTGAEEQDGPGESGAGWQIQSGEPPVICVHVCGAVRNPGVYELAADSRVFEAVREAGGFTAEADESYVNQAQRLTDGAKLVIPTVDQVKNAGEDGEDSLEGIGIVEGSGAEPSGDYGVSAGNSGTESTESVSDGKININTASEAQLCEIPGIGATRAAAIVAYRQQSGGFGSTEDIMNVSGIKEGTYAKIKDRITVN